MRFFVHEASPLLESVDSFDQGSSSVAWLSQFVDVVLSVSVLGDKLGRPGSSEVPTSNTCLVRSEVSLAVPDQLC